MNPTPPPHPARGGLGNNLALVAGGAAIILVAGLFAIAMLTGNSDLPKTSTALPAHKVDSSDTTAEADKPTPIPVDSTSSEPTEKDAWLSTLADLESASIDQASPQILKALQCKDREVRLRAVNLLITFKDNPSVLPLLAVAQRDADAEVRSAAISVLENTELKTNLSPYLLNATADADDDVRSSAIQTAWSLSPEQRDGFIGQAVNSSHDDVSSAAFEMLKHEYSTRTVQLLLNVYASNDPARIKNANDVMNTLLNQTFSNAAEASAWWQQHQGEYNDDLSPKTTDSNP